MMQVWRAVVMVALLVVVRSATAGALSAVNVRAFGAVGDGVVDDTAAVNRAVAFAHSSGRSLYLPKGIYRIDNGSGALMFQAFSGSVYGDGVSLTSLVCTSTKNSCIHFQNPTNLELYGFSVSMGSVLAQCNADTTNCGNFRNNSRLIDTEGGANLSVHDVYLHDGSSAGLAIDGATGVTLQNLSARRVYGNGFYITNDTRVQATKLSTQSSQDAGFEVSRWDFVAGVDRPGLCSGITLTGYTSLNDFGGFNINGCQHVQISSFSIRHTWVGGIDVQQDPTTTKSQWPDDVTIFNGTIADVGGGNPVNSAVTAIHLVERATQGNNLQHVSMHDITVDGGNVGSVSVKVGVDPTIVANFANIKVTNAGGACFDLGGGYIQATSLTCDTARSAAFTIRTSIEFTGTNLLAHNAPNTGKGDSNSLVVATGTAGVVALDGVDLTSSLRPAQVSIRDLDDRGRHTYTGVRFSVTDAATPTVELRNPGSSISYQVNGGPQKRMGSPQ